MKIKDAVKISSSQLRLSWEKKKVKNKTVREKKRRRRKISEATKNSGPISISNKLRPTTLPACSCIYVYMPQHKKIFHPLLFLFMRIPFTFFSASKCFLSHSLNYLRARAKGKLFMYHRPPIPFHFHSEIAC